MNRKKLCTFHTNLGNVCFFTLAVRERQMHGAGRNGGKHGIMCLHWKFCIIFGMIPSLPGCIKEVDLCPYDNILGHYWFVCSTLISTMLRKSDNDSKKCFSVYSTGMHRFVDKTNIRTNKTYFANMGAFYRWTSRLFINPGLHDLLLLLLLTIDHLIYNSRWRKRMIKSLWATWFLCASYALIFVENVLCISMLRFLG